MNHPDLEAAIDDLRALVARSHDPRGALGRLRRHLRREEAFAASPAALPVDELIAARTCGARLAEFAAGRREERV